MSKQDELVDEVLHALHRAGILEHLLIVGSWSIYFYRHHYQAAEALLSPLKTSDIDFDVSLLPRSPVAVDIPKLLEKMGFLLTFHLNGSMQLVHSEIAIDFLTEEKGRGTEEVLKMPSFGIVAQPLRFLSLLEEDVLKVPYQGLVVRVPHPVRFAVHKLVISQRRKHLTRTHRNPKEGRDIRQALEVLNMLCQFGEQEKIKTVFSELTSKQKKYVRQALGTAPAVEQLALMPVDILGYIDSV